MNLSIFGVKWPVTTTMIFMAIVLLGAFSWTQVGLDLMPEFEIPAVTIITTYSGAGPQEIESTITEPIEEAVSTVENVDEITSQSLEGVSLVTVKFAWGSDLAAATNDIRDKLDLVSKRLPEDADKSTIFKFNTSMIPVMMISAKANESWEKLDKIVEKKVVDAIKRVPGVATAIQLGGDQRGILVDLDRERLRASGLSGDEIVRILSNQNIDSPGGNISQGQFEYLVRTPGIFKQVEDLRSVVLKTQPGVVRLGDIAEVRDAFLEKTNEFLIDGTKGIGVMVQKQSGANTVSVSNAVRKALPDIQAQLPEDVTIEVFFDTSDFIKSTIDNLTTSILLGGVAVFLVTLFFLRDIKASLIVCTTIPTSLIITFLLMYLAGYTLNQISLSSLAIAIGMVVDNSIVILDNIKRYLDRGVSAKESAISGAVEMGTAVFASTLTTIVIFLPIIFTSGITSIFFGQLATIVTMALIASLFSALMLMPMMCSKFLAPKKITRQNTDTNLSFIERFEISYSNLLKHLLKHPWLTVGTVVTLFLLLVPLVKNIGAEFIPEQDQGRFAINYELPVGTRYEKTGEIGKQIEEIVKNNIGSYESIMLRYGRSSGGRGGMSGAREYSHTGQINVRLVEKDKRDLGIKEVIESLRPKVEAIPGVITRFDSGDPMANMMGAGGAGFTLHLYGYDLQVGMKWANDLTSSLSKIEGLRDLEINQDLAQPELQIEVNREKASSLGFNISEIGKTVETYISGNTRVKFKDGGDEYDIVVRLREKDRISSSDINLIPLIAPDGKVVRLENIANVKSAFGPTSVSRNEQERYIKITGQVYGKSPTEVLADAENVIHSIPVPPGFSWKFAGTEKDRQESFMLLVQAGILGLILVYMVMASQFESLLSPFIIAMSVPFGFMGALLALLLTKSNLSVVALLGFLILIGIVVNNGIILISSIGILLKRKLPLEKAILEAGKTRLTPVLSTTTTTILGMLPMALSHGEGSEVWVPLGISVIGGLCVSTIMTLLVIPVLYLLFSKWLVTTRERA